MTSSMAVVRNARALALGVLLSACAGIAAQATGSSSTSIAANSVASGTGAVAIGSAATATAQNASALGTNTDATATSATAVGTGAQATASQATAVGYSVTCSVADAICLGGNAVAYMQMPAGYNYFFRTQYTGVAAASTPVAADYMGGVVYVSTAADANWTLPAGADIDTAMASAVPDIQNNGTTSAFCCMVVPSPGFRANFPATGAGTTFIGVTPATAADQCRWLMFKRTAANTWSVFAT